MKRQNKFSWKPGSRGGKLQPYTAEELKEAIEVLERSIASGNVQHQPALEDLLDIQRRNSLF